MNKVLLVLGICLLLYPVARRFMSEGEQADRIASYEREMSRVDEKKIEECLSKARNYNKRLYEEGWFERTEYEKQLVFGGKQTGIMGSLTIPKINLKLPIQHGTEEGVLSACVGHVIESSLPVGGVNTHSVLSGHRGTPEQELFTRLDELEERDVFVLNVGRQKLIYRVFRIQTVRPDEVNAVAIEKDRDLVSLVTCTPYGLNTHRLVVTGERVDDTKEVVIMPAKKTVSKWNVIPCIVAGVSVVAAVIRGIQSRKKRKERAHEQHRGATATRRRRKTVLRQSRKDVQRRVSAGRRV